MRRSSGPRCTAGTRGLRRSIWSTRTAFVQSGEAWVRRNRPNPSTLQQLTGGGGQHRPAVLPDVRAGGHHRCLVVASPGNRARGHHRRAGHLLARHGLRIGRHRLAGQQGRPHGPRQGAFALLRVPELGVPSCSASYSGSACPTSCTRTSRRGAARHGCLRCTSHEGGHGRGVPSCSARGRHGV